MSAAEVLAAEATDAQRDLAHAQALLHTARRFLAIRSGRFVAARGALAAAIEEAVNAREELLAAVDLVEQAARLVALRKDATR